VAAASVASPTTESSVLSPETIATLERLGRVLHAIGDALSPYLVPICLVVAWLVVLSAVANAIAGIRAAARRFQAAHSIPCSRCVYFTGDHRLKCSIDPIAAGSEAAIDCPHYEEDRGVYASTRRFS